MSTLTQTYSPEGDEPRELQSSENHHQSASNEGRKLGFALLQSRGDWTIPRMLIDRDVEYKGYKDDFGKNLVHYAVRANAPATLVHDMIVGKGIDVNHRDNDGWTPLHVFMALNRRCDLELLKCLLDHGADPSIQNLEGNNIMVMAALHGAPADMIEQILLHGGDPNSRTPEAETPLIFAAKKTQVPWLNEDAVAMLLKYDANPFLRDNTGRNALDWGREKGRETLVKMMRQSRFRSGSIKAA